MKPTRKGYAVSTGYQKYYATNGEETIDIAKAKICYSANKSQSLLAKAKRRYPEAQLMEVTIGTDSQKRLTVNGFPRVAIVSRSALRRSIWNKYGGRCAYCGVEIAFHNCHMDAYYPSKGLVPENMMPACGVCYGHKKGKTPAEFQAFIESCFISVKKNYLYNYAKRYGLVTESLKPLTFYYLTPEAKNNKLE